MRFENKSVYFIFNLINLGCLINIYIVFILFMVNYENNFSRVEYCFFFYFLGAIIEV